jgi:hypothetical protein
MSIAKTRHDRTRLDGKPLFIVRTPIPLTRKFMGVEFINGVGKTQYPERAKRFDEEFGYEVQLPKGYNVWKLAQGNSIVHGVEVGYEDGDSDDEGDEDSE